MVVVVGVQGESHNKLSACQLVVRYQIILFSRLVGVHESSNVEAMFEKFDEDHDGKITFEEFLK